MYKPQFHLTHPLIKSLNSIEKSKVVIDEIPLPYELEEEMRVDALVSSIYHSSRIDGSVLNHVQVRQLLLGATLGGYTPEVQEVLNLKRALDAIAEFVKVDREYSVDILKELHSLIVYNLIPVYKMGAFRQSQIVIREEETGNVLYTPPQPIQVEGLVHEVFEWLKSEESKHIHPVIRSGVVHFVLNAIHPFIEGSGKAIRLLSRYILEKEGYDFKRLVSVEEGLDDEEGEYYEQSMDPLSSAANLGDIDLTGWIEYYAQIIAKSLTPIEEKIRTHKNEFFSGKNVRAKIGDEVPLSARQIKLIEFLSEKGRAQMRELREFMPSISEDTILRDLTALVKKGIVEKEGSTKASSYMLKK